MNEGKILPINEEDNGMLKTQRKVKCNVFFKKKPFNL